MEQDDKTHCNSLNLRNWLNTLVRRIKVAVFGRQNLPVVEPESRTYDQIEAALAFDTRVLQEYTDARYRQLAHLRGLRDSRTVVFPGHEVIINGIDWSATGHQTMQARWEAMAARELQTSEDSRLIEQLPASKQTDTKITPPHPTPKRAVHWVPGKPRVLLRERTSASSPDSASDPGCATEPRSPC